MANITINTQSQQYQRTLARFRELKAWLAPKIRLYFTLDEAGPKQWRQRDPRLREVLAMTRKVSGEARDGQL